MENSSIIHGSPHKRKRRFGLTSWILLGIFLGLAYGLFVGEYAANLEIIGDAYVGLMQMTVLPYIVFSLIANIGKLDLADTKQLVKTGIITLVGLWTAGIIILVSFSHFALPYLEHGAFFSTSLLEPHHPINFLKIFVPSNPFWSLTNNSVPAVVIFSLLFGIAIIGLENRKGLLNQLDIINATLGRVTQMIVRLTPIGVFCITASTAGTLTLTEFERLQAYLLIFSLSTFLATLITLPMLVAAFTPFSYLKILRASRSAMLIAFVTGNLFVVIPLLIDEANQLFKNQRSEGVDKADLPNVLVPLAYQFPALGKVTALVFVPFAAWFYGNPLTLQDYPFFVSTGIFVLFGSLFTAIPILLDSLQIPQDIFQLFIPCGVIAGRIGQSANGMHLLALTILITSAMSGLLRVRWRSLFWALGLTILFTSAAIAGIRYILTTTNVDDYRKEAVILRMQLLESNVPVRILQASAPNPFPLEKGQSRLDRIKARGKIRVGYLPDRLPYSYSNSLDQLVGLDVALMHELARDLEVGIEFVPYQETSLAQQLKDDHFDFAISGVTATTDLFTHMLFSEPYADIHMAVLVLDNQRDLFDSEDEVRGMDSLVLGVEAGSYFAEQIRNHLPDAKIVELSSEHEFFQNQKTHLDALVTSAEGGSVWTLIHPEFVVASPFENNEEVPLVLALAGEDFPLEDYLKNWIRLKRLDGTIDALFDKWIFGKPKRPKKPRWSIIRDVFKWEK